MVETLRMRSNLLIGCAISLLTLVVPTTARAQQPEVGVSYSYARITNGDGLNLPAGFLVSIAGGGRSSPWLVGEVAGNFRSERNETLKLFTIQGGVRFFSETREGMRPFAQLLVGLASLNLRGESTNKVAIEPGAGIDLPLGQGIAFRAGFGVPFVVTEGENLRLLRITMGIVFGGP